MCLHRWLKPLGVSFPCQKRQRQGQGILLGNHLIATSTEFYGKSGKYHAPHVYIDNLVNKVEYMLDENDR